MSDDPITHDLLHFVQSIHPNTCPVDALSADIPLEDVGLADSFSIIQIILHLEQQYGIDLAAAGVDPSDFRSVSAIREIITKARA